MPRAGLSSAQHCQAQGGVLGGAALCHWLALCHTTLWGPKRLCPPVGGRLICSKQLGAGGFCRAVVMSGVCQGAVACPPRHRGTRGLWGIPGPWGGNRGRGEVAQGSRLKTPSLHPSNTARVRAQQSQMGYRAHLCSPDLPQPERCRRTGGQFPSGWEPSSTPDTHCSETASANPACTLPPWGPALPGEAAAPEGLAALGARSMRAPSLPQRPRVPGTRVHTARGCLDLFAHACTQHGKQSRSWYTHTQGTRVCTLSPCTSVSAGLPAVGFRPWDRQHREGTGTPQRFRAPLACVLLFTRRFQGANRPQLPGSAVTHSGLGLSHPRYAETQSHAKQRCWLAAYALPPAGVVSRV